MWRSRRKPLLSSIGIGMNSLQSKMLTHRGVVEKNIISLQQSGEHNIYPFRH